MKYKQFDENGRVIEVDYSKKTTTITEPLPAEMFADNVSKENEQVAESVIEMLADNSNENKQE